MHIAVLVVVLLSASAEEYDPTEIASENEPIVRPEKQDNFGAYRPNYLLLGDGEDQVLFQFSFRYNLWPTSDRFDYYLAYTQRSWWDLYDIEGSSPFTENNYSPELIFRWRFRDYTGRGIDQLQFGYQHESNGEDSVESRSWDRFYIEPRYVYYFGEPSLDTPSVRAYLRLWVIVGKDPFNRDIDDFMGPGELIVNGSGGKTDLGQFEAEILLRKGGYNFRFDRGAAQLGLRWIPPWGEHVRFTPGLYLQAFFGYGQSLLRYNVRDDAVRAGVFFDG